MDYILNKKDVNPNNIFIFGRSLGGAVAISLSSKNQKTIRGLIVENSFTSIDDMIDIVIPTLKHFKFLSRNKWNNMEKIQNFVDLPILFISGQADELIPPRQMKMLYEKCPSKKKDMKLYPFGTHNETWNQPSYYESLAHFVKKYIE